MSNTIKSTVFYITTLFVSLLYFQVATAQTYVLNNTSSELEVHGTSSLHDWELITEEQSGKAVVENSGDFAITSLSFSVKAESLKSGKSGMDKNTYKALNTGKYKTIDFNLTSVSSIEKISENSFKATVKGDLTISGSKKSISLTLNIKLEGAKLLVEGEKPLKMTDFGIEPPKALLGTIKTGDAIKIIFKSVYNKK
ncbi:YceI family protein [Winogradskyella sp. SYSU M77433]|uniref:YceI family protein n=1 Tax=Winogradskyella sp. SYSU M77433 TaxID=3042722 RepID=UPI0024804094|nr:YceI family protein [Winogradskyella sp. SYSU M77433]MDH7912885.1 YceI family protein [Winogradskyella sp. SYSU M77433]